MPGAPSMTMRRRRNERAPEGTRRPSGEVFQEKVDQRPQLVAARYSTARAADAMRQRTHDRPGARGHANGRGGADGRVERSGLDLDRDVHERLVGLADQARSAGQQIDAVES